MLHRVVSLAFLFVAAAVARGATNVVYVLADDLGVGDLRTYNPDSKIPTPHLDRFGEQAMAFTDAHSPSSVCTPTRYALLTGRYAWRSRLKSGVLWGDDRLLIEPGRSTIAAAMKRRGYRTACVGKWHLGLGAYDPDSPDAKADFTRPFDAGPHTVGFDASLVLPASLDIPPYVLVENGEAPPLTRYTLGSRRRWEGGGGFWRAGAMAEGFDVHTTLRTLTDRAIRELEAGVAGERPFFLFYALTAPHTPWVPRAEFQGKSDAGWYGDYVVEVDHEFGRLMKALDDSGAAAETIVLFASDNGAHWRREDVAEFGHDAHLGRRGMKADIHEGGHRVPFLVRWPGHVEAGTKSDALVGLQDLYATLADLVGFERGDGEAEDSESFLTALRGEKEAGRAELVHHSYDGMFALRAGDWKLIEGLGSGGFTFPYRVAPVPGGPKGQLYDLANDPAEKRNLYLKRPEVVERLARRLAEIRGE